MNCNESYTGGSHEWRALGWSALLGGAVLAIVGTLIYLPIGAALFAVLTFLAWKWSPPVWLRVAVSSVLVVLLFLLSGVITTGTGESGAEPAS